LQSVHQNLKKNRMNSQPGSRIIVALDVATEKAALGLVEQLAPAISFFKIGLQLYTAAGPEIVRQVRATGAQVFLDLKLHDIPNTVGHAVESAQALDVQLLTIHLSGGSEMIRAAVAARKSDLRILGVTVLTSLDDEGLHEIGVTDNVDIEVLRLAKLGVAAGIDGVVASPLEIEILRPEFGSSLTIVTPGIRPSRADASDQKRCLSPREALAAGADYLVIGRPITAQADPREAASKILEEISGK
jgi:orotidine-5'-phosphate decarboxylase